MPSVIVFFRLYPSVVPSYATSVHPFALTLRLFIRRPAFFLPAPLERVEMTFLHLNFSLPSLSSHSYPSFPLPFFSPSHRHPLYVSRSKFRSVQRFSWSPSPPLPNLPTPSASSPYPLHSLPVSSHPCPFTVIFSVRSFPSYHLFSSLFHPLIQSSVPYRLHLGFF